MDRPSYFFASRKWRNAKKSWHKFSKNPLSIIGLGVVLLSVFLAMFAPYIVPFPQDAETYVYNAAKVDLPPTWSHLFGTDDFGRDVFSRVIFGFRYSLMMAAVILALVVPLGVILGLLAGYFKGSWIDTVTMRVTDVFLCVPGLVLAMAICAVTTPSLLNAMIAISVCWWPYYCRLLYGTTSSLRNEFFVQAAQVTGEGTFTILFSEILPNCLGSILTKMTLDVAWVILVGATLSFIGLGAQPPTPDLGTMVSSGAKFLSTGQWWISIFPALAIVFVILGFNLLGDGVRDIFATMER
jgi:peptide/nickel transport system permease protein